MKKLIASSVTIRGYKVLKLLNVELKTTNNPFELKTINDNINSLRTLIISGNTKHVDLIAKSYGL